MKPLKIVLDTNVVLDCFVFHDPCVSAVLAAIGDRSALLLSDASCTAELERVLSYPQLRLDFEAQRAVMARYGRHANRFDGAAAVAPIPLPRCRDADDQKFLELARDAAADLLITKDKALLALAKPRYGIHAFKIIQPTAFVSFIR